MHRPRITRTMSISALFLTVGLILLAGCGTNSTSATTTTTLSSTSATATACATAFGGSRANTFRAVSGTLKSISGQNLIVTNQRGTDVTVTYSSKTTFSQQVSVAPTSLQEGTAVRVTVVSSASTYTATTITVESAGSNTGFGGGFPGRGNGTPRAGRGTPGICFNRGAFGTPGASGGTSTANFRGITGTISQVSSSLMVITDSSGASYSVNLDAQTRVTETKSVTASALKVGEPLTIIGTAKQATSIDASSIAILLSLPEFSRTATPTP
jgi:hypothetical protein